MISPTSRRSKIVAAAAIAVALLLAALLWPRRPRAPRPVAPAPTPAAPATPPAPPPQSRLVAASGARVVGEAALASGAFAGRVLDFSTGKGVPGAQVTFEGAPGSATVAADAEGRFAFEPAAPGRWTLAVASAPGFLPFAPEWGHSPIAFFARPGLRIDDLTVFLRPALDYTGVVLDPGGAPVAGATVTLLGAGAGEQALSPLQERYLSDARGEFVFHAPDDAVLEARHPGFASGRAQLDAPATVSHRLTIRLGRASAADAELGAAGLRGRVVDRSGAGVAGALVRAEHTGDDALHPSAETRTGADGGFTLGGLDPGLHLVRAACAGCAPATARAPTGGEVTLTVTTGGLLAGRAVDAGGAPIPAFTVVVTRPRGLAEADVDEVTVVDAEGHFEIGGLEPGDYRVRGVAANHAPSPPASAHVGGPDDEPAQVLLQLGAGGALRGEVVELGNGKPLVWARVTVEGGSGEGSSAVPLSATTVTGERGEFTLSGIAPGARSVLVAAADHHMKLLSVQIAEGETAGPLHVELGATEEGERPTMELFGIGAQLHAEDDALVIGGLVPGGGAQRAGLLPGDAIVRIEGVPVTEIGFQDSIMRIRGPEGTRLRLGIRRGAAVNDVVVERRRIAF